MHYLTIDIYFSVFEAGTLRSQCQHGLHWWRPYSWFTDGCLLAILCPYSGEGPDSLTFLLTFLLPFKRALLSSPNHLPKILPANTISLGEALYIFKSGYGSFKWGPKESSLAQFDVKRKCQGVNNPGLILAQFTMESSGQILFSSLYADNHEAHSTSFSERRSQGHQTLVTHSN